MPRFIPCFAFLLLLLIFCSCSRQPFKDEVEETAYYNKLFVDSANSLMYAHGDTTAALQYFHKQAAVLKKQSLYVKAARFSLIANYHYFFTNKNELTAAAIDSVLAIFNTPALQNRYPRMYVANEIFAGHIAYRLQHYNQANEHYFRAKILGEARLNPCEQRAINYNLAMVLYRQQNYEQSKKHFQLSYAQHISCSPQTTAMALQQQEIQSNIGLCLVELGQYDSALVYFDQALQTATRWKDSLGPVFMDRIRGVLYGHQAKVHLAKGQYKTAENLGKQSIAINSRPGYETDHAQKMKLQLAAIYSRQARYDDMHQVLQNLRQELDTAGNPALELGWQQYMSDYYEQTNQPLKALNFFKQYVGVRDSMSKQQKLLSDADVARQLVEKANELEIALLKKDNEMASISLVVTIGASLMAGIILILLHQNYRRSKKSLQTSLALNEVIRQQEEAREKEASLRHKEITEAVIQAQESERALIGLELHDNINQVLTTVKLHHEMVLNDMGEPKKLLTRASGYLQDCINEIRSLSKRLSAPSLGKISLEESVNDLLDTVSLTGKVKINREIRGIRHKLLHQSLHVGLYRIFQEQLNNVLKHAGASEVMVRIEREGELLRLTIADNGKGFDARKKYRGIGLVNMQTRAENLNGRFEIQTRPGAGCLVTVEVPLEPELN